MSTYAKTIIDDKFWVIETDGVKLGVLKVNEQNKYIFSSNNIVKTYDSKRILLDEFGDNFFVKEKKYKAVECVVHGYPTLSEPHHTMFDLKRNLPLFTKSDKSKSVFCAGYYIVKFNQRWVKSFCPKLMTIDRYPYFGPFKTELEAKQKLSDVREN